MRSKLAVASLVLGILALPTSLVCVGLLLAVPAVICGHKALRRIRSDVQLTGHGLAVSGLITGYLSMVLWVFVMPAVAITSFVKALDTANRNQCKANLERILKAKQQWAAGETKSVLAKPSTEELTKLLGMEFFDIRCPKGGVYDVRTIGENPTCSFQDHSLEKLRCAVLRWKTNPSVAAVAAS